MADGIRVRFAPSPTGYLHVGGARTALFNWLFARKSDGLFLLRIEDTDRQRSSPEHTQVILDGLTWLGLDWDEEIVFQGARLSRHIEWAERLKATDQTYEDEGALRFRMPQGAIVWDDMVQGKKSFDGANVPDWVVLRSDGTPTYNFSVVVDDIDMKLTHVIRGDDHVSNTPKQLAVYQALDIQPPKFGHVPMIHGPDGRKLSKRHGATAVGEYRHAGILPPAMRNFLALLGWNPGDDRELFFEMTELLDAFSIEGIQRKSAIFDTKKLEWMNGQYISQTNPEDLYGLVEPILTRDYNFPNTADPATVKRILHVVRDRARTTNNLAKQTAVRLDAKYIERDEKADKFIQKDGETFRQSLAAAAGSLGDVGEADWNPEGLDKELRALAEKMGVGLGKIMQPIRIALTGGTVSEPVNDLLFVVGKTESVNRLKAAITWEPTAV